MCWQVCLICAAGRAWRLSTLTAAAPRSCAAAAHCSAFTARCSRLIVPLIVQLGVPLSTCRTMHLQAGHTEMDSESAKSGTGAKHPCKREPMSWHHPRCGAAAQPHQHCTAAPHCTSAAVHAAVQPLTRVPQLLPPLNPLIRADGAVGAHVAANMNRGRMASTL